MALVKIILTMSVLWLIVLALGALAGPAPEHTPASLSDLGSDPCARANQLPVSAVRTFNGNSFQLYDVTCSDGLVVQAEGK